MNMKKLFALGATLVFAVAAFTGCGGQQQAASSSGSGSGSGAGGKIVVGLDDNFPPMGFKDENNEIVGRYYMSTHPDTIDAVDVAVGPVSQFGIAFAKDNQKLRDDVQKVLDEMVKDGTVAKISEKWFGKDITLKK